MGVYTYLEDQQIDQLVENHLQRIVGAVCARINPYAIVLRGSFGRGEGSVILENDHTKFLSDYEIDVITGSPLHRRLFADLTRELSNEFGMDAGLRWNRPDCLVKNRLGPLAVGKAIPSISLYEFRYGSRILWGKDFITNGPPIDPNTIPLQSGIRLMLNRMAESLFYMAPGDDRVDESLNYYYWINKTILACAEALLLSWRQYHYSYAERGRRFSSLAYDRLDFMSEYKYRMIALVDQATEFKLRPRTGLYRDSIRQTWLQVIPVCDEVFRHLVFEEMGLSISDYSDYPENILFQRPSRFEFMKKIGFMLGWALEMNKAFKARNLPAHLPAGMLPSQIVYAVVPLLFLSYGRSDTTALLAEARKWISKLTTLPPPSPELAEDWDILRQKLFGLWKIYCY